jgi:hypothetical protein
LTAYRYDLIGSLLGIGTFTLMSFLHAPSVVWGLVASLVFLSLAPRREFHRRRPVLVESDDALLVNHMVENRSVP